MPGAGTGTAQLMAAVEVVAAVWKISDGAKQLGGVQVYVNPFAGRPGVALAELKLNHWVELFAVPAVELLKETVVGFSLLLKSLALAPLSPICLEA